MLSLLNVCMRKRCIANSPSVQLKSEKRENKYICILIVTELRKSMQTCQNAQCNNLTDFLTNTIETNISRKGQKFATTKL